MQRDYVDDLERSWKENLAPQWDLTPIDPTSLQQRSNSHLVKVEYENDNNKLDLQLRTMNNRIGSRKVENRNYQANYNLNIGDYVDLNVLAAHNLGKQKYPKNSRFRMGAGWIIWNQKHSQSFGYQQQLFFQTSPKNRFKSHRRFQFL